MKKIILISILIFISFGNASIVLTHINYFSIESGSYIYDTNIVLNKNSTTISSTTTSKNSDYVFNMAGKYVFPGFLLTGIDSIDYPYLDLWSDSGITSAFSYSKDYYLILRISSKDPSTLIKKSLTVLDYKKRACDLISSSLIFNEKKLSEKYIEYSIYLRNPSSVIVYPQSIGYLQTIARIAKTHRLLLITKINNLKDFKESIRNKANLIMGIPTEKIDFKVPNSFYIVSNLKEIKDRYGYNSSEYRKSLYNLKLLHKNGNKILISNFDKIGIPYKEIKLLSTFLSPKEIIFSMTKYPYELFDYNNKNDFLIFNEDPLKNVDNLKSLFLVVKNGEIANIARGSIDYSQNANLRLSKSIKNTSLFLMTSIYPIISFDKKWLGLGNDLYFPKINTNTYFNIFLSKGYNIGVDTGISYKDYFYDYEYIFDEYEKRSLYFKNNERSLGYYGEYVARNPFPYTEYDDGLFENLFYKDKNINILLGLDRITNNGYFKLETKMERKSNQDVKIFAGISSSNFYQYKVNMGNLNFFDNYEECSKFLFSLNVEGTIYSMKNIFYIPIGGNVYLNDKGLGIYFYTGIRVDKASILLMDNFDKFKVRIYFDNFNFK